MSQLIVGTEVETYSSSLEILPSTKCFYDNNIIIVKYYLVERIRLLVEVQ